MTSPLSISPGVPRTEWGIEGRAANGQAISGDTHVVAPYPRGLLVSVIDGLGHGEAAAAASRTAADVLATSPAEPLETLLRRCHLALARTRGAVLSLASVSDGTLTWSGVGNVGGLLVRADTTAARPREALLTRGGVLGHRLPPLRIARLAISPGDTLIFATDGISGSFADQVSPFEIPRGIAERLVREHSRADDDALVLVVRYLGAE